THNEMKRRLEERYRIRWSDLVVTGGECPARVLVFHDPRDGRVPFQDGEAIVRTWPNAELVSTRGLGHHRILRDPGVISRAVSFLSGTVSGPAPSKRRPAPLRPALVS
ncbi:MAG TPA: hypothetical protein VIY96_02120, partial [Thermoanaerobaculia bacterium]